MDTATVSPVHSTKPYKKENIPKAVREQLWIRDMGQKFKGKCKTSWCQNKVSVFDFHAGHNIPESNGGITSIDNLVVICSRCNLSMANNYTFIEWSSKFRGKGIHSIWVRYFSCLFNGKN
jgi:5-methylcytosine-specific restriction endonuclease McrA